MSERVIVVGAGVAGLRAALDLAHAGLQVTVVESRDRVGGRIFSEQVAGCDVEMGAEFIHGLPHETLTLLEQYGLEYYELDGDFLLYDGAGGIELQGESSDEEESPFDLLERMTEWAELHPQHDMNFSAWLAEQKVDRDSARHATAFVEGFNAADADVIGVQGLALQQRAEDEIDGARAFHVRGGYGQLPWKMEEELRSLGGEIVLNFVVNKIDALSEGVTIIAADGRMFEGRAAVIATPLGTLQQGAMLWTTPVDIFTPVHRLAAGAATRISMIFKDRWWAALGYEKMSFLLPKTRDRDDGAPRFGVFWTPYPELQPMITAWTGGKSAKPFEGMTQRQMEAVALRDLERAFGLSLGSLHDALVASRWHNWLADPNTLGAYSSVPSGALDTVEAMTRPVGNTLFFAGEHTDTTGHWGTVHGAIRSGVRAAKQVIAALSRGKAVDNKK